MYCVETIHLNHRFSAQSKVLNDICLQVPTGSIYGFLGPNGAGKTTTLRLLLGLIQKQQGEVLFFDRPFQQHRLAILAKIGSLIETPSLYGHLTAKENLQIMQRIYQCKKERIDYVLQSVGLPDTANKKVSQFSLGMKQRLSIAVALLHQPRLLILDEPTNGLDPNGIIEMRDLLKKLNEEEGISVIISSHLLAEIEKLVTHVGIISKGNMVFQGKLKDLINKQYQSSRLVLSTNNNERANSLAQSLEMNGKVYKERITLPLPPPENIAAFNRLLVQNGIDVYEMSTVKKDLETIFIELINQ